MDDWSRVIAAIALTPRAQAIAEFAAHLSHLLGAELTLVYVGTPTEDERQRLEGVVAALHRHGTQPALEIREGRPEKVIRQMAVELGAQCIVLGALEQDSAVRDILGSVARRIARTARCSVLLLPDPLNARLDKIVVSTGLDDKSAAMMNFTIDLARRAGTTKLHVVHEYHAEAGLARLATPAEEVAKYQRERAELHRHMLGNFLATFDLNGLNVRSRELEGFEGLEAVRYADRRNADLLVVAAPARRLSFWDRFFHHPLENVLQNLPCAVLLYRPISSQRNAP